ncbi:hypothetical protein RQN30_10265 [Arcanobacterium hippocoleae]
MIQHTEMLVRGLNGVGMELIKNATKGEAGAVAGKAVEESMRAALEDLGITEQLALLPILFLPWLLSIAAVIVIPIVVMMRFLELYVLTAGASLPLVFLANQETKSMGVGYLRKLLVAILHGFTLIIAVKIYAAFQADSLNAAPSLKELFADFNIVVLLQNMGLLILGQIMLIVVVMAAGRFAKAFVGE